MFIVASELHLYSVVLMKIWRDVSSSEHVLGRPSSIEQDDHSLWMNMATYYLVSLLTPKVDRHGSTSTIMLGYEELLG